MSFLGGLPQVLRKREQKTNICQYSPDFCNSCTENCIPMNCMISKNHASAAFVYAILLFQVLTLQSLPILS